MKSVIFMSIIWLTEGYLNNGLLSISITRNHKGDIFIAQGEKCYKDLCLSLSGGTAVPTGSSECECKCTPESPVFRDDINTCVDDIQECSLLPFASGSLIKKIPYVFLPLKGQIVYPSADILISDIETPVCVVSGGQFLGQNGWLNLRNNSGAETPFRLFRDEGRTFLQWIGESNLRMAMEGRIILVHLMCKDASATEEPKIFTPCIAFRVAGNPSVKEMMFITDVHLKEEYSGGLSMREYIAIGICSLLLAIVYVGAVFLYLHIQRRKRKKGNKKPKEDGQLTLGEEGIIKNNPLLQATRHLSTGGQDNAGYLSESNSCCSDTDQTSDLLCFDDDEILGSQNLQTSAIVHPCEMDYGEATINQDSNTIEKLPEENVSIVETLEVKDDHPETIKAMGCANGRRKLYFNPSYFEPDLLKAPPPAAMEFLIKIREVISIAKQKMSAKKFSPSLLGIPEEDGSSKASNVSALNLRKDPSAVDSYGLKKAPRVVKTSGNNFHLPNELCWPSDNKQKIIRKWLEDVPVMVLQADERKPKKVLSQENKIINKLKVWQMNEGDSCAIPTPPARQEKKKIKGKAPPIPLAQTETKQQPKIEKREITTSESVAPPRPPPMPSFQQNSDEIPRVQGKDFVPPAIAKNLMDAVIQELTSYKKNDKNSNLKELPGKLDEDFKENQETPKQQPETSEEVIEIENNPEEQNTIVRSPQDDHEYELILLNADPPSIGGKDLKIYNLPEILSKNERTEGYSLVSEVYVNDGYSCCSGESSTSSYSNGSRESDKVHYDTPNENTGRLTIHVNDSPERYKTSASESDNFEPDTLDRKPKRTKLLKKLTEESERYSNQKFQDMECCKNSNKSENFTDSLERPTIMLKSNGTFKRNSIEKDIDDFFRNFSWSKVEGVGSLREIYEAKSRNHRKRTETTSLIGVESFQSDHDRFSTLSWSEERKNKLLHRGIILHINEKESRKHKRTEKCGSHIVNSPKVPYRPPKPCPSPRSRSVSPAVRSNCTSPSSGFLVSPRSASPPLPPPRSIPTSPSPGSVTVSPLPRSTCSPPPRSTCSPPPRSTCSPPPRSTGSPSSRSPCSPPPRSITSSTQSQQRSGNTSPISMDHRKNCTSPSSHSPVNSVHRNFKNFNSQSTCSSPVLSQATSSSFSPVSPLPPPRPPKTINNSPLLPPRNTKPPLPPKNSKRHPKPGKFAGRPLPPLPRSSKDSSSPVPCRDPETLSTYSGASVDSLNSSDYEAFYTIPYEEEEEDEGTGGSCKENSSKQFAPTTPSTAVKSLRPTASPNLNRSKRNPNQRFREPERRSWRGTHKAIPHRPEDSGYLSTDSDSCCQQILFPPQFNRISENGSQNSETEESLCDGASESGGESIATDSFFYGNFKKKKEGTTGSGSGSGSEVYPYSLRLSDVEVNSDTERHCVPIMVRP